MRYYPIYLDIKHRECLVVGGGGVATRKVDTLLKCGAVVTVVSLEASQALQALADNQRITLKLRAYKADDLNHKFLVIGATNDEVLNKQISKDAESHRSIRPFALTKKTSALGVTNGNNIDFCTATPKAADAFRNERQLSYSSQPSCMGSSRYLEGMPHIVVEMRSNMVFEYRIGQPEL